MLPLVTVVFPNRNSRPIPEDGFPCKFPAINASSDEIISHGGMRGENVEAFVGGLAGLRAVWKLWKWV